MVRIEYHGFKYTGHGFGIDIGIDTERRVDHAVQFCLDKILKLKNTILNSPRFKISTACLEEALAIAG